MLPLHRRPGIMVVDDEPGVRNLLCEVLRQDGCEVWAAGDGEEALDLYRGCQERLDLVLLDVRMPARDGPQTLKELRRLNPAVRCCFLTGHPGPYSEEQLLQAGALRIMRKPFQVHELVALVRQLTTSEGSPAAE